MQKRGIKGLYAGVPAVVIGNAAKAGVRFTTYDQFKAALKDDEVSSRGGVKLACDLHIRQLCYSPVAAVDGRLTRRAISPRPDPCSQASARV